ncbi:FAD-dependent oxidoreductase [soil metagenome]
MLVACAANITGAQTTLVTPKAGPDDSPSYDLSYSVSYDVVVVGSEPEGIMAAVAAAESGAATLLITEDENLGGLFVLGAMNSLDLRTQPFLYQQGLFERWWRAVGRGHSFDVVRAEAVFVTMLAEAGVTVRTGAPPLSPVVTGSVTGNSAVTGVRVADAGGAVGGMIYAPQFVDATADVSFAAAAGAGYRVGFATLGLDARMADTLVFRIDGVDWNALERGVWARGKQYASVDDWVAWGHFGGYPAAYQPVEAGLRLRGLNLGRQEDGSVLVNALLVYGVDPFDAASIDDGRARAEREAPRVVDYLRELPGFQKVRFGGVAQRLYLRETRHLDAQCLLSADDVLDNRVSSEDVVAGGYPLDVQTLTPFDSGYVFGTPDIYGAQLCVTVPQNVNNLWVVGKAAGYDPIAASSARVVPFGMALGEAVGVAAAFGVANGLTPQQLAAQTSAVQSVRDRLRVRGAYLPQVSARQPVGPVANPYYLDYRLMLSRGLAVGGYANDPNLGALVTELNYLYLLSNVGQRFLSSAALGQDLVARFPTQSETAGAAPLSPAQALAITQDAACQLGYCVGASWDALRAAGIAPVSFSPGAVLTRGEMYALAAGVARLQPVFNTAAKE